MMVVRINPLAVAATIALMGGGLLAPAPPAKAQALQRAVDVCTGITLPRSAVTEIIGAVNGPIVNQIETTVNGLTDVVVILSPLATLTDLDIDLTTILSDAAAGDPISLRIVDTEGNVLTGSDDCNLTADAITLDEEGGISIGGNRITGLGTNGRAASAAEVDAIAFGDNASTAVGATGAVAIGRDASATAANSVALGAGSVADRGAQAGYTAPGLAGTYTSLGAVSVGTAGGERQITNVAPGTADTDAATVGQVTGAVAAATADGVRYDTGARAQITLDGGVDGTSITNLAPGALSATSTDAVNGSQLYATNQNVSSNFSAIVDIEGRVTDNTADIAANGVLIADNSVALAALDGRVVTNAGDIAANGGLITGNTSAIAGLDGRVTDNTAAIDASAAQIADNTTGIGANTTAIVDLDTRVGANTTAIATNAGAIADNGAAISANVSAIADNAAAIDANVTLIADTSVALADLDGRVSGNTTAIAGIDTRVTDNTAGIAAIDARVGDNTTAIAANGSAIVGLDARVGTVENDLDALSDVAVTYTDVNRAELAFPGVGGTTLSNVAAGEVSATSSDAVNGSQLFASNARIGAAEVAIQANADAIASIGGSGTALGLVYDDATRASITLDGPDGTVVSNVAAGAVAEGSSDAVNGGQLFATNTRVDRNETEIGNLDVRVTANTDDIAGIDNRVTVNEGAIAAIDGRVTVNEGNITAIDSRVAVNEGDIVDLDGRVTVNEDEISDIDARVAINTSDIATVNDRVDTVETSVTNMSATLANLPLGYVSDADRSTPSATPTNTATLIAASGGATVLTNLAAGNLSATSTDAVNGAQLFATNADVSTNIDAIVANARAIANLTARIDLEFGDGGDAGGSGGVVDMVAVRYSSAADPHGSSNGVQTNHATLVGSNPDETVALHNVADGVLTNDAVNMGQLRSGLLDIQAVAQDYVDTQVTAALDTAIAYTDERFAQVGFSLANLEANASAGTAGAMSIAGLPQATVPGGSLISGAVGHYRGETAWSLGLSTASSDGKVVVKAGATLHTRGDLGATVGAGIAF